MRGVIYAFSIDNAPNIIGRAGEREQWEREPADK